MPFNRLHVPQDLAPALCRDINTALHESLVATCAVNPEDDFALICRYAPGDMLFHPTFLGARDPDNTIVIEIALLGGRSDAQKEALYIDMRARFAELGLEPGNSIMFLLENQLVDWSFSAAGSVKSVLGL